MYNFLDRRGDRISQILIYGMSGLISEEGNFIKRVDGEIDTLSYLPIKKYLPPLPVSSKLRTHSISPKCPSFI